MDIDLSVAGLPRDKVQKVSSFRVTANMILACNSQGSMSVQEAVKYLHAARFDSKRAEDIFINFQKHYKLYSLSNLSSQKQLLNAEIRSKKIEILGARDNDGAQLLLYTASRHDPKSCDHKTAMQLLFLLLDQISESPETQSKGITLLLDLKNTLSSTYDPKYTSAILNVLEGGYPLYLHMVYVVECPSWFNGGNIHKGLQEKGKIKLATVSELSNYISSSSLPTTLGGTLNPSKSATLVSSATNDFPRHKNSSKLNGATPPVAPPPRHNRPLVKQLSVPISNGKPVEDQELEAHLAGNVNKMRDIFQQSTPAPSSTHLPTKQLPRDKKQLTTETKSTNKPLPPPKNTVWEKISTNGIGVSGVTKVPMLPSPSRVKRKPTAEVATNGTSDEKENLKKESYSAEEVNLEKEDFDAFRSRSSSEDKLHSVAGGKSSSSQLGKKLFRLNHHQSGEKLSSEGSGESSAAKKMMKSLVQIKIFNKLSGGKENESSKSEEEESSSEKPPLKAKPNSQLSMYQNVSIKPARPIAKIHNESNDSEAATSSVSTSASSQQNCHPYKVATVSPPPTSPPPPPIIANSSPPPTTSAPPPPPSTAAPPPPSATTPPTSTSSRNTYAQVTYINKGQSDKGPSDKPRRNEYENIFIGDAVEDEGEILTAADNEVIYENYGPNTGNKWMSASELQQYIKERGKNGLSAEYYTIKNEPLKGSSDNFRLPCNTSKNRYKDVVCYDSSRVKLSTIPGVEGSDYIHANYIHGYKKTNSTILTQGPLKRTVNDYWRMLWEKEAFVVVMATKCVEMAKLKCTQYWPDENETSKFGDIEVTVVHNEVYPSYEFRQFKAVRKGIKRTVMHYQFLGWPDYGVPSSGSETLEVLYAAREMQGSYRDYVSDPERFPVYGPPMVIHCSAGIGRSGTFCALDYCIDELRMTNKVNVQNCVRLLRQQRAFSIQTDEQYIFCYNTVLEYALYLKSVLKL